MRRTCCGLLLAGLAACEAPSPPGEADVAPVARMFFPQLALAGAPAQVDARASSDDNDDVLAFALNAGDGAPAAESADGLFEHVYEVAGTFEIELVVRDETGLEARAFGDVVVVADDAGCDCALGCFEDAVCTPRGCELFSSSDDTADGVPADVIDCE